MSIIKRENFCVTCQNWNINISVDTKEGNVCYRCARNILNRCKKKERRLNTGFQDFDTSKPIKPMPPPKRCITCKHYQAGVFAKTKAGDICASCARQIFERCQKKERKAK